MRDAWLRWPRQHQTLPFGALDGHHCTVAVVQVTRIVAEVELRKVLIQVDAADVVIDATESAFEVCKVALGGVRVDRTARVLLSSRLS